MVNPKITENAISTLLAERLKGKIPIVIPFSRIDTPNGSREVDIFCKDGGTYLIEAKYSEKDLLQAIAKIQNDYIKYSKVLEINGGFALLYPEELKRIVDPEQLETLIKKYKFTLVCQFPQEDMRPFTKIEGDIDKIASEITELIMKPLRPIAIDVKFTIDTLKKSTRYIVDSLGELPETEIKTFFSEQEIFRHILPTKKGEIPLSSLRNGIAYILLTQLLFYHILSKIREDIPKIDSDRISSPKDLDLLFIELMNKTKDYKAIFSYKIANILPNKENVISKIRELINVIGGLSPEKIGGDLLGTVFHDLIPFEVRKAIGAYYTNVLAAEMLAWLSIEKPNAKVIDLAAGSGGLLVAAYRRKKYLSFKKFDEKIHSSFLEKELFGIDIMPFASAIAASHLAIQEPKYFTQKVNIGVWDSTELSPGMSIPTIMNTFGKFLSKTIGQKKLDHGATKLEKSVVEMTASTDEIKLTKVDTVIMNPPFTRQERIPEEYKAILSDRFKAYQKYISGQMSYFGYFLFLGDKFIDTNGRLAFVMPATFLSKKQTEGLRKFISENYFIEYIILNREGLSFSESTMFREILFVAKKTENLRGKTKLIFIKRFPRTLDESRKIATRIKEAKKDVDDELVIIKMIDYQVLTQNIDNWYKWLIYSQLPEFIEKITRSKQVKSFEPYIKNTARLDLDKIKFGEFHGFVLYNQDRALSDDDLWIMTEEKKDKILIKHKAVGVILELPRSILKRGLRRHTNVLSLDVTNIADFLIYKLDPKVKELANYSLTKEQLKQLNDQNFALRKAYIEKRECNLVILRRPFIASPGTRCISFYSDDKIVGIDMWNIALADSDEMKILCLWFNSSLTLLQLLSLGITAEGSWAKINEDVLSKLLIIDINKIDNGDKKVLLNLFEKLKAKKFESLLKQFTDLDEDRMLLDKTFLKILGFKNNEIDDYLKKVYEIVGSDLKILAQAESETEKD
ncbi:MAG: N-6 DNA methylase [Nitrososphaeria archaeon]